MAPRETESGRADPRLRAVRLEVIAPTFEGQGFCAPCELVFAGAGLGGPPAERGLDELPAEWVESYRRLTEWVLDLARRYGETLQIHVIDPQSPLGLLKSVRHWVRRYPTWLVDGRERVTGWDRDALDGAIAAAARRKDV